MLRPASFILLAASFFLCTPAGAEPALHKCTDGEQITYTDKPCGKLGLKAAGPIRNTVTIVPAAAQEARVPDKKFPREQPEKQTGERRERPVQDADKSIFEDPFSSR